MVIRPILEADKPSWRRLAGEVAQLFGFPEMPDDPDFSRYMDSKIAKQEALAAADPMTSRIYGVIGFSRTHNRVSWFAVSEDHRQKGIGTRLLHDAIGQMNASREISVCTFHQEDSLGQSARAIYRKFGFVESKPLHFDDQGHRRSIWVLSPGRTEPGSP